MVPLRLGDLPRLGPPGRDPGPGSAVPAGENERQFCERAPTIGAQDMAAPHACQACGNPNISDDFRRVFGDNDHTAWGCPNCYTWSALHRGAACDPDRDGDRDLMSVSPVRS